MTDPTVTVLSETAPTLKEAQGVVGGYVERVFLQNGDQMLVDEEGLLKQLPVNAQATVLSGQLIVGNALVLTGTARWLDDDADDSEDYEEDDDDDDE
jgi:hypothetical protein